MGIHRSISDIFEYVPTIIINEIMLCRSSHTCQSPAIRIYLSFPQRIGVLRARGGEVKQHGESLYTRRLASSSLAVNVPHRIILKRVPVL